MKLNLSPGARLALTATFFFSLMQIGVKSLDRLPAAEIVFFRALLLLLISFGMIMRKGLKPFGNNKPLLLARGLCGAIALFLFFYTLKHIPLATAVTLQYLSPIFTILFAMWIMKERTVARQWLAFAVAMAGVLLVKGFDPRVSFFHMGLGVLSATFSGLAYNFIRKLKDHDHPLIVVMYFPLVTIPVVIPFLIGQWIWPTPWEWLVIVFVGICTQIAQISMTYSYQLEKASDVTIYKYTGIIYALAWGFFIFGEGLELLSLFGMIVVIGGVYLGSRGSGYRRHVAPSTEGPPQENVITDNKTINNGG